MQAMNFIYLAFLSTYCYPYNLMGENGHQVIICGHNFMYRFMLLLWYYNFTDK